MSDYVTLSCPSCGGKLQITSDIDRFACAHCGSEHIVKRAGGTVSLAPLVQAVEQVRVGVDKTASELAIQRLSAELARLQANTDTVPIDRQPVLQYRRRGLVFGASIFVLTLLIAFVLTSLTSVSGQLLGICGGLGLLLGLLVFVQYLARANREIEYQIDEYIARKRAELEKHRQIVSR